MNTWIFSTLVFIGIHDTVFSNGFLEVNSNDVMIVNQRLNSVKEKPLDISIGLCQLTSGKSNSTMACVDELLYNNISMRDRTL
mgnify:CR=1